MFDLLSWDINFFSSVFSFDMGALFLTSYAWLIACFLMQSIDWDSGKTHIYRCHVSADGSYTFKVHLSYWSYACIYIFVALIVTNFLNSTSPQWLIFIIICYMIFIRSLALLLMLLFINRNLFKNFQLFFFKENWRLDIFPSIFI